jgi:ATP/maltotriose-dependent transcriptional regulator MalT
MGLCYITPQPPLSSILLWGEVKRVAVFAALDSCGGNYRLAAHLLCIGKTTLYRTARKGHYQSVIVQGKALMTLPRRRTVQPKRPARPSTSSRIVELLLQGCDNREIARQLNVTCRTVKAHFNRLFRSFGIIGGIKRVKLATLLYRRQHACA